MNQVHCRVDNHGCFYTASRDIITLVSPRRGRFKEAARNVNQLKPYRALNRVSECFN